MIGYAWGKIKESVSGWEKSHFGGFYRMIQDYPYIKLDININIEPDKSLTTDLAFYTAEKLIKLYIVKVQKVSCIPHLRQETVKIPNKFTGVEETFIATYLDNDEVLDVVIQESSEYAPLFQHYAKGILNSRLLKKVDKNDENKEGDGDNKDNDEDQQESSSKESSEDKKQEQINKAAAEMRQALKDIKEFEPWKGKNSLSEYSQVPKFMPANPFNLEGEYRFSSHEYRDAENLLKLLDISFDPKSAEIKSLRAGKLDTLKIAEVAAGSTSIYKQTVEDQDTKPFGICILGDMSGSMNYGERLNMQRHTLNVLYLALSQIVPADKLWMYLHTGDEYPEIYQLHTPYTTDYALQIKGYKHIDTQQNYDGPVIEAIHKKIRETCDDRIIFISLSDGQPSGNCYGGEQDIIDMKRILERARRDEFVTVSIGMQYMSTPGLYIYNKTVEDLSNLARDVSQVVNKVVRAEFK